MREKLIMLLEHDDCPLFMVFGDNVGLLADYLIAHGVTIQTEAENLKTNGDRIRAMSDEEIAKIFTSAVADGCPQKMYWDCVKDEYGWDACDACWCKWLKQPAED